MKSNLFLLIGEDKKLIDFNLFNILDNIKYDDNNKITYDMNFDSFMDVMDEASTISLFSSVKVIIVNNFVIDNINDYELEYLDRFVNNKIDNNIFDYVCNKIKDRGYKIDNINIEYLLSKAGNDINNINNELEKLFAYKENDKKIFKDDIDLLVFDNIDNVIYEFTNAILDNDYDKIKIMYDKFVIDNVGVDYLISTLANSVRT